MKIKEKNIINAYNEADVNEKKKLYKKIFPDIDMTDEQQPITKRIKTFEDAIKELGEDNEFVKEYRDVQDRITTPDLTAYLKLRIITAALNEGWRPQFTEDECRYFPWFYIYTKDDLDKLSEEVRSRVVGRSYCSCASGGLVFAIASYASSNSHSHHGSWLALKKKELAEYAGKQFAQIWADYVLGNNVNNKAEQI